MKMIDNFNQSGIPFTQGCFVPSLVEIGQSGLRAEDFKNFVNVFLLFHYYLPLRKEVALYLNKLETTYPKDAFAKFG